MAVAIAIGTALLRVYTGAHLPLDVIGGAALGVAIGAALTLALGVPVTRPVRSSRIRRARCSSLPTVVSGLATVGRSRRMLVMSSASASAVG